MISTIQGLANVAGFAPGGRVRAETHPVAKPDGPPGRGDLAGEVFAGLQLPRLLASAPKLLSAPRGDGSVVIDMPGWKAPESSMAPLRAYLRRLGYDSRTWGLGNNLGNPERDAGLMTAKVRRVAEQSGRPVALVGWSLGGVVAREVAREIPDLVSGVVTFGSPIVGGPSHTVAARSYSPEERQRVEALIRKVERDKPIRVPVTVIYTKRDGIVNWRACIDERTPGASHVEVRSGHMGMGIDPDVWITVAEALAANRI